MYTPDLFSVDVNIKLILDLLSGDGGGGLFGGKMILLKCKFKK